VKKMENVRMNEIFIRISVPFCFILSVDTRVSHG